MQRTNYYSATGGLGLSSLGQVADQLRPADDSVAMVSRGATMAWGTVALISSGASAYHGYLRSRGSVGAAVGWGLLGALFPIITPAVALAQGFGRPLRANRRRRRAAPTKRRRTSRRTSRSASR